MGLNSSPKMKTLTHRTLWSRGFGLSQSSFGESCSPPRSRSPFQDSSTSLLSIGRSAARILEVGTLGNHLVATVERRPNDGTGSNGERSGQGGARAPTPPQPSTRSFARSSVGSGVQRASFVLSRCTPHDPTVKLLGSGVGGWVGVSARATPTASRFTPSTTRRQVVTRLLMVNRRQGGSVGGGARAPNPLTSMSLRKLWSGECVESGERARATTPPPPPHR